MVTVTEASAIVLANVPPFSISAISVDLAVGRSLAGAVSADRDLPPINRATMDGIAISHNTWSRGFRSFVVEGIQAAGQAPQTLSNPEHCIEIMTGAALPAGTDTVIPYEQITLENKNATVTSDRVNHRQNVHSRGSDALAGTSLLQPGTLISPAEVALLSSVGKKLVEVFDFPSTAIVSTGDELVPIDSTPLPHQVRRSNSYAIQAAMMEIGWPSKTFHLPDDKEVVTAQLDNILKSHETVIISGGVSKGKFDFVPDALEANGIVKRFHRVNQRPGKPFWFGTSGDGRKTVFALPGNPVSTYLCFYRYVRPWIFKGHHIAREPEYAVLARDFEGPPDMTYFLQVAVKNEKGTLTAYPNAGGGSGDFANLKEVTGFLELPGSGSPAKKGDAYPYYSFR
ncbi:molybdopterin molybdotransferase MoeA [Chryseolinea sp. T2]|uniref:molybdopterin molybdotransferase MoeA n=1 Tax=Chryseolinea sp. T2 TaxID=3129255 RepID=UPI003077BF9B